MTELEIVNQKIAGLRAELKALYAQRAAIPKEKRVARTTSSERIKQVFALAMQGKDLREIACDVGLKKNTVRHYLWCAIFNAASESLLAKNRATVERPNIYGGATWIYDNAEHRAEMIEINARLDHGLSERSL